MEGVHNGGGSKPTCERGLRREGRMPTHRPTLDSLIAYSTTHGGPLHRESHETRRAGGWNSGPCGFPWGTARARSGSVPAPASGLASALPYGLVLFCVFMYNTDRTGHGRGSGRASAACVLCVAPSQQRGPTRPTQDKTHIALLAAHAGRVPRACSTRKTEF